MCGEDGRPLKGGATPTRTLPWTCWKPFFPRSAWGKPACAKPTSAAPPCLGLTSPNLTNLEHCDLSGADLTFTTFANANLEQTQLAEARLDGAVILGCDLSSLVMIIPKPDIMWYWGFGNNSVKWVIARSKDIQNNIDRVLDTVTIFWTLVWLGVPKLPDGPGA